MKDGDEEETEKDEEFSEGNEEGIEEGEDGRSPMPESTSTAAAAVPHCREKEEEQRSVRDEGRERR